jgi:hypothetical protein
MVGHLFTGDFGPFSGILLFIVRLKNANHNSFGARVSCHICGGENPKDMGMQKFPVPK